MFKIFKGEYVTSFLIIFSFLVTAIPGMKELVLCNSSLAYVTNIFCHSDLSTHWLNNMFLIALLGPTIENHFGAIKMSLMIVLTALVENLVCNGIGMSGIAYMFIILSCFCRKDKTISFTCIALASFELIPELKNWIFADDNIGHSAHFMGGVMGFIFGLIDNKLNLEKN